MATKQVVVYAEDGGKYRFTSKHLRGGGRWTTREQIKGAFKKHRAFVRNGYYSAESERLTMKSEFVNGFASTLGKITLRIGCKVFSGANFTKLKKWAMAK